MPGRYRHAREFILWPPRRNTLDQQFYQMKHSMSFFHTLNHFLRIKCGRRRKEDKGNEKQPAYKNYWTAELLHEKPIIIKPLHYTSSVWWIYLDSEWSRWFIVGSGWCLYKRKKIRRSEKSTGKIFYKLFPKYLKAKPIGWIHVSKNTRHLNN